MDPLLAYIESNFILELAYLQEEHEACESILKLAEKRQIGLAVPAFCLTEPLESWVRRERERRGFRNQFSRQMRELTRSQPFDHLDVQSQEIERALLLSSEQEKQNLDSLLVRIARVARIIPVDLSTIEAAIRAQDDRDLSPQDAVVYASLIMDLERPSPLESCFLTKNSRDFSTPAILADLLGKKCRALFRFTHALGYIQSLLTLTNDHE
jgi:predicted nucleic acid-binding protein